jgi:hypothetical protein
MQQRSKLACAFGESAVHYGRRGLSRATLLTRLLPGLLVACIFAGCNNGDSASPSGIPSANPTASIPTALQPASPGGRAGRFTGKVTIGGATYYGDAILTADGEMRLYVADGYVDDGSIQRVKPRSSAQLVGKVDMSSAGPVGTGFVVGEHCTATGTNRFCRETASAEIRIGQITGAGWDKRLAGEIRVKTSEADEIWQLELGHWVNYYDGPANTSSLAGLWDEQLAEFARDGDTIVRIDGMGRLFFQSAHTGCIGNGIVAAHLDGKVGVYDVALTIEGCNAERASLNGEFKGLASTTASSVWNYDDVLRIWLSTQEVKPRAITMLAYARY